MGKFIDLTGMIFGRLTVIRSNGKTNQNRALWLCECCCKNRTLITTSGSSLRGGLTKSCGCLRIENNKKLKREDGKPAINRLIRIYKRGAKIRGIRYELTEEEFIEITSSKCYYCNCSPEQICKNVSKSKNYVYNGIDRLDSNMGYILENCVPCCKHCNIAKSDLSEYDFYKLIRSIYLNKNL